MDAANRTKGCVDSIFSTGIHRSRAPLSAVASTGRRLP
jgi:hypothetical protein